MYARHGCFGAIPIYIESLPTLRTRITVMSKSLQKRDLKRNRRKALFESNCVQKRLHLYILKHQGSIQLNTNEWLNTHLEFWMNSGWL